MILNLFSKLLLFHHIAEIWIVFGWYPIILHINCDDIAKEL